MNSTMVKFKERLSVFGVMREWCRVGVVEEVRSQHSSKKLETDPLTFFFLLAVRVTMLIASDGYAPRSHTMQIRVKRGDTLRRKGRGSRRFKDEGVAGHTPPEGAVMGGLPSPEMQRSLRGGEGGCGGSLDQPNLACHTVWQKPIRSTCTAGIAPGAGA